MSAPTLQEIIAAEAAAHGVSVTSLTVLAPQNDPYRTTKHEAHKRYGGDE